MKRMGCKWLAVAALALCAMNVLAVTNDVQTVEEKDVAELRAENEALRAENQMLRRQLVTAKGALPDKLMPTKVVEKSAPPEAQGEDTGYWLSAKSKVRHNRRCRNYRKVKGRPCGPDDGRPCKKCGG